MDILITGCTDTHINKPDRAKSTKFMSIPDALCATLSYMGHYVEHRAVVEGEDLDKFDKVICFLYPLDRHARHPDGALYALRVRRDAIIALDDWSFQNVLPTWEPLVYGLRARRWLVPMFKWGDVGKLGLAVGDLITYDPSPAYTMPYVDPWSQRLRHWVHASFHKDSHIWTANQLCKWRVLAFGCKDLAQDRILESTVVRLHGVVAGSLIPPYAHVGSGWWRVRVLHSIYSGAVIGCDHNEFNGLSPALEIPIGTIENMDDDALHRLSISQGEIIQAELGTTNELKKALQFALGGV